VATTTDLGTDTFDELHARIGLVPLNRIRTKPAPGTATEQHVLEARDGPVKRLFELVDGVLVEKAVGSPESFLGGRLFRIVGDYADEYELGVVLPGDGPLRLKPGNIRYPDVSFIPWESLPGGELPTDKIWDVTPALAVEVLSESNTPAEMDRKLNDLFSAGCKLVWFIDPPTKTARVYTSAKKFKELDETGTLDGGKVLPGFKLQLADLFAATKRRKKKPR
jgi:Uma2 family endonuclease